MDIDSPMSDDQGPIIHLLPAPIPTNGHALWSESGRTILSTLSPASNDIAAWVAPKADSTARAWVDENGIPREEVPSRAGKSYDQDKAIYMGSWGSADASLHEFYKDTFMIFTSAQAIHQIHVAPLMSGNLGSSSTHSGPLGFNRDQERKRVGYMRELAENYIEAIEDVVRDSNLEASIRSHHLSILRILSLSTLLFFPQDGLGDSLFGEELLDWLNSYGDGDGWGAVCDSANRLAGRVKEWEEEDWESTVCLAILRGPEVAQRLLQSLSDSHPEPQIAAFAEMLSSALLKLPRSKDVHLHPTSASFLAAHAAWREDLRAAISLFCDAKDDAGGRLELEIDVDGVDRVIIEEEAERWESTLIRFARIMLGEDEVVLDTVDSEGDGDWKLALGVWGMWVNTSLKRDRYTDEGWADGGLRSSLQRIKESLLSDNDTPEDNVMVAMCNYDITTALVRCNQLSLWLSTHLTDLLEKLDLVDDDDDETYELPLRDYFVIQYADMLLMSNPGYWEIGCDYLSGCGAQGVGRIREILRRTSLGLESSGGARQTSDTATSLAEEQDHETATAANEPLETINAVIKVAAEHGLEDERREICRLAALRLLSLHRYGEAIAYCVHSTSKRILAVIIEAMLDVYCTQGAEAYLAAVETIPVSLLGRPDDLEREGNLKRSTESPGQDRTKDPSLGFLALFADYLTSKAENDNRQAAHVLIMCLAESLAPATFLGVLLMESLVLLEDEEVLLDENETCEILRHLDLVDQGSVHQPKLFLGRLRSNHFRRGFHADGAEPINLTLSPQDHGGKPNAKVIDWDLSDCSKGLDIVRLAAARNLARLDMV